MAKSNEFQMNGWLTLRWKKKPSWWQKILINWSLNRM